MFTCSVSIEYLIIIYIYIQWQILFLENLLLIFKILSVSSAIRKYQEMN